MRWFMLVVALMVAVLLALACDNYERVTLAEECDRELRSQFLDWPAGEELRGIEMSFGVKKHDGFVRMELTRRNLTDDRVTYDLAATGARFFVLDASTCEAVWEEAESPLLSIQGFTMEPNEVFMHKRDWELVRTVPGEEEAPVEPGEYLLYASYPTVVYLDDNWGPDRKSTAYLSPPATVRVPH